MSDENGGGDRGNINEEGVNDALPILTHSVSACRTNRSGF